MSFAQNLFFVAMLLYPVPKDEEQTIWLPSRLLQLAQLMAYSFVLFLAPVLARAPESEMFVVVIAVVRLGIFLPLLLRWVRPKGNIFGRQQPLHECQDGVSMSYGYLAYGMIFVMQHLRVTRSRNREPASSFFMGLDPTPVLWALNDDPSVSALGFDAIVGIASAFAWVWMNQDSDGLSAKRDHKPLLDRSSGQKSSLFMSAMSLPRRSRVLVIEQILAGLSWFVVLAAIDWAQAKSGQTLGA